MSPPLVLTPGDPAGIGPEITRKALAAEPQDVVVIGDPSDLPDTWSRVPAVRADHRGVGLLVPPPGEEPVEVRALRVAVDACLDGRARALVTGPIHKARLRARGFPFTGHTDFLAHLTGGRAVMAFAGGDLRVALVTTHVPLRGVSGLLTVERVRYTVETTAAALRDQLGLARPRVVVCGVNPHAGEQGELGDEEQRVIGPACDAARAAGWDVVGPLGSETAFRLAGTGAVDLVVAMYHDQGLAPLKLVDFGRSVNWTLGLPIVRTSVDHGTADDIAGQERADPSSMLAAIRLALRVS